MCALVAFSMARDNWDFKYWGIKDGENMCIELKYACRGGM